MPTQARQHDQEGTSAEGNQPESGRSESFLEQQARRLWHQRKGEKADSENEDDQDRPWADEAARVMTGSTPHDLLTGSTPLR